ncbi:MAG: YdjC family protein [Firmicutes bacterium]|nr:YdjC family protein [Bacillota bacterium]
MLNLIINADDLGLTPGCNQGIIKALTDGIVTDTTLLINTDYTQHAVELVKLHNINRVGLHLNLTWGQPLLPSREVPSLVDENGRFRRKAAEAVTYMKPSEIKRELTAQVEKFQATGLGLTHLDSHHHVHTYPEVLDIAIDLAREVGVPLRQGNMVVCQAIRSACAITTDAISLDFYEQGATLEKLQEIIKNQRYGTLEIMCHPAEPEQLLYDISSYNVWRTQELSVLTSAVMREFLEANNVRLMGFDGLQA